MCMGIFILLAVMDTLGNIEIPLLETLIVLLLLFHLQGVSDEPTSLRKEIVYEVLQLLPFHTFNILTVKSSGTHL